MDDATNLLLLSDIAQGSLESSVNTDFSYYPEYTAKTHNGLKYPSCAGGFIVGRCSQGHTHAKITLCGKEWCPTCGAKDSFYHKRRVARWWDKALSFNSMGYMVVTVPMELWHHFGNKMCLNAFNTYLRRKLQGIGKDKGLSRWHWAGEDGRTYKPHLNFLFEGGYIPQKEIRKFRREVGQWLNNKFRAELKGVKVSPNLYYQYFTDDAHKVHKLKYVTRATMTTYNPIVAKNLKGFHTTRSWGKFEKSEHKRTSDLVSYENGQCPCCGEKITWGEHMNMRKFRLLYGALTHVVKPADGGYYFIELINSS